MIPPRVFLIIGVSFLICSHALGWISFGVSDWLQYNERDSSKSPTQRNSANETISLAELPIVLKKFGLWQKCIYQKDSNDFVCDDWNNDTPGNHRL